MLAPAKMYEEALQKQYCTTVLDPYYSWAHGCYPDANIDVDENFWEKIQLVSVHNDTVIGYFVAAWSRPGNYIDALSCMHFGNHKTTNIQFAMDLRNFLKYLAYDLKVPKIAWSVFKGNPVEEHYDRLIRKFGGRIMGTDRYSSKINGEWCDRKYYEWINDYYECFHCGHRVKKEAEVMCWKCGLGEMIYRNPFGAH